MTTDTALGLIGYLLTEIIRLRIPKVAVQVGTGENGKHLIWADAAGRRLLVHPPMFRDREATV